MPSTSSVGHSLSSCPSTSCPQHSPQSKCCWSRTPSLHRSKAAASCSLQCPTAPLALGPSQHREQLLSWQAQAQARMHKGVKSSTGWPTCCGWMSKWERQNHHPLEGMLWECTYTCLAVQVPSLPQRGLPGSSHWAHQWRSWLQVALGSLLCNVQP